MNMKTLLILSIVSLFTFSCLEKVDDYPKYSLTSINYIPDSLKSEHREWIKEAIRSASQHMSGGDYEDVDQTIRQAKTRQMNYSNLEFWV